MRHMYTSMSYYATHVHDVVGDEERQQPTLYGSTRTEIAVCSTYMAVCGHISSSMERYGAVCCRGEELRRLFTSSV
jgi:hypothetical protein